MGRVWGSTGFDEGLALDDSARAGVVQWQNGSFPSCIREFILSPAPLFFPQIVLTPTTSGMWSRDYFVRHRHRHRHRHDAQAGGNPIAAGTGRACGNWIAHGRSGHAGRIRHLFDPEERCGRPEQRVRVPGSRRGHRPLSREPAGWKGGPHRPLQGQGRRASRWQSNRRRDRARSWHWIAHGRSGMPVDSTSLLSRRGVAARNSGFASLVVDGVTGLYRVNLLAG